MKLKNIFVTEPFLPPLEEFQPYLEQIWRSKILTNGGPYHQQLEKELTKYLGVKHISLFTNATVALITAVKALEIRGEVITTPYSFVATAHSLLWNGITPVFVDIDANTLNIDPQKIEAAITENTTAIMPVHVYGRPCDVDKIEKIAIKYNLKVIYDAAHAFGVTNEKGSILNYGDLSVLSFHATKVFNTFEGGAIISNELKTKNYIDKLKNFGFLDEVTVIETGINGKMSEINAAFGILQLKYQELVIQKRKKIDEYYKDMLCNIKGIELISDTVNIKSNYSYFPIMINKNFPIKRDELYDDFKINNINVRRYFYPLITDFPMYKELQLISKHGLINAKKAASEVLCLPIYPEMQIEDQKRVVSIISKYN